MAVSVNLILRGIRLVAITSDGPFGASFLFGPGLNILRGPNTTGKSTLVQAIVYALGLEAMLTAKHEIPLPPAMKEILTDENEQEVPVLESYVALEIGNGSEIVTIQRWAKHERIKSNLIALWNGPLISAIGEGLERRDFYVRLSGAAREEAGFHDWLRKFIGWDLPTIVKADGSEVPLYLEFLFPLLCVEQKHGWSAIQAQTPHYAGILEPRKRAREFILALEVFDQISERQSLKQEQQRITDAWRAAVSTFSAMLDRLGVVPKGIPQDPTTQWPLLSPPTLTIPTVEGARTFDESVHDLEEELSVLLEHEIPTAEQAASEATKRLEGAESELNLILAAIAQSDEELRFEEVQLDALNRRLIALAEDRRKHEDIRTLRRLGSTQELEKLDSECPTCHQPIPGVLLANIDSDWAPMSIEDNISFIDQQSQTFEAIRNEASTSLGSKKRQLFALRERSAELKKEIRALKATLTSASDTPSIAAVRRQVLIGERLDFLRRLENDFEIFMTEMGNLASSYHRVRGSLAALPAQALSESDSRKLKLLENRFLGQLSEYGFISFPVELISISEVSYLPVREGFDLGFDLSASDWIRVIWAYLLGLLEVARFVTTNHPGLLVFDEPRQQEADPLSFSALLKRASKARAHGQQVLFATSEPEESLREMLENVPHVLLTYPGRLLRRVEQ